MKPYQYEIIRGNLKVVFDTWGLDSFMIINKEGKVLDSTFKEGSKPFQQQLEEVQKLRKKVGY